MSISKKEIKKMTLFMKDNCVKPRKIKTRKEAAIATKNDILGKKWGVGEEFYILHTNEYEVKVSL